MNTCLFLRNKNFLPAALIVYSLWWHSLP